jgi:hypothetical protein
VTTQRVPIPEAARRLGVSIPTVKRRLKRGELAGVQEPTRGGFKWFIDLEPVESPEPPGEPPPEDSREDSREPPVSPLAVQRAQEMAEYTERLLAPWRTIVQQQAEEIGALKAQLAAATATAPPPETASAPPAEGRTGRSWWARLWGLS